MEVAFLNVVVYRLNNMLQSGSLQRITGQWSESKTDGNCKGGNNKDGLKGVTIEKTAILLVLLTFGMAISVLTFLLEVFLFYSRLGRQYSNLLWVPCQWVHIFDLKIFSCFNFKIWVHNVCWLYYLEIYLDIRYAVLLRNSGYYSSSQEEI